jgi:RNA polymerase sigma-70 factor (ECF subfamily)
MRRNSGNEPEEYTLINSLHNGDERVLSVIFDQYHTGLLYFAMNYVANTHEAEDVVAETFITLWQKKKDFEKLAAIKSFLYTAVRNACLNKLKQRKRHSNSHKEIEYLSDKWEEVYPAQIIKAELMQQIWLDIEQLPPIRRKIFKMIYLDGLSIFEIATTLGISVDTVRVQKARALHTLRAFVQQKNDS